MQEELVFATFLEDNEAEKAKDYQFIQSCYPKEAKVYQKIIEEECDKLEYEGSTMYAQYLDQAATERIASRISNQCRRDGYCKDNDGICPMIMVMLCNEMYIRRCRRCNRARLFR